MSAPWIVATGLDGSVKSHLVERLADGGAVSAAVSRLRAVVPRDLRGRLAVRRRPRRPHAVRPRCPADETPHPGLAGSRAEPRLAARVERQLRLRARAGLSLRADGGAPAPLRARAAHRLHPHDCRPGSARFWLAIRLSRGSGTTRRPSSTAPARPPTTSTRRLGCSSPSRCRPSGLDRRRRQPEVGRRGAAPPDQPRLVRPPRGSATLPPVIARPTPVVPG